MYFFSSRAHNFVLKLRCKSLSSVIVFILKRAGICYVAGGSKKKIRVAEPEPPGYGLGGLLIPYGSP
jgi:hypothetical protein